MDVTESTKDLIYKVQRLKAKHTDPVSTTFIDFYCQCCQGVDYLFPEGMRSSVQLLDILQWFFQCVDSKEPPTLVRLMWQDIVGPTLEEYQEDEGIEQRLLRTFESGALQLYIQNWDRERNPDGSDHLKGNGSVHLVLRELLEDIQNLEQETQR
ncbi:MAG: hypothetical protein AAGE59_01600 [Cyanobacteria bacterium P01_F01_bin.86]